MSKETVFTAELVADLLADFMAATEVVHRPASQVMRDYIQQQRDALQ